MMANKIFEVAFNILGNVNSSFTAAFSTAAERMSRLNTNVSSLRTQIRDLERAQRSSAGITMEQSVALGQLRNQLILAEAAQQRYARALTLRQRAEKIQSAAGNVAMGAAAVGGAMFAGPVMASMNFETSMAQVAKQVDDARDATGELSDIGRQAESDILEMSQALMKSPVEIANAYALGARAGVKGTENLKKITEMGVMMGTAFEMPAEQVTTAMAKIGNALGYNLETADGIAKLEALADTINYVDDKTLATGTDLIDFMTRTAGTITALAPTMSEGLTVGLGAGLLAAGERSETAGTAINALMTKLAAAPTQAKSFQVALAQIGMSAEELQASIIDNADAAIMDLFTRINQLDQATRNNVLADLIGQEHIDTVSKLTGNYDKFIDAIKKANDEAAKGSVRKEFEIMSQTTARQMEGLKAAFERTFITLGNNLLPVVQSIGVGLVGMLEQVQSFAKEYPNLTNALVVGSAVVLGLGVALGGTVWAIAGVVGSATTLYTTVTGLGLATKIATAAQWLWNAALTANPIGLVIVGVAALIAAGYYLYKNWGAVKDFFAGLWDSAAASLSSFADGAVASLAEAGSFLTSKWESAKTVLFDFFTALPGQIAYGIGYAVGFLLSLPARIAQFVTGSIAMITQWGTETYQAIVTWLPQAYETFTQWISNTITDAVTLFYSLPELAGAALTAFAANIESWASGVYDSVVNWFSQIPNAIADAFGQAGAFINNLWSKASGFAASIGMSFDAGRSAGGLPGHAAGGIFDQEHIARFAEGGRPEAVIPLDGSPRAVSIWETAGSMMGLFNQQDSPGSVFKNFAGQGQAGRQGDTIIQFSPTIHVAGGGDAGGIKESVAATMREAMDELERRLDDIQRRRERLSYG